MFASNLSQPLKESQMIWHKGIMMPPSSTVSSVHVSNQKIRLRHPTVNVDAFATSMACCDLDPKSKQVISRS